MAKKKLSSIAAQLGKKGGKVRRKQLMAMTPEQRSAIARKAGLASGVIRRKKAEARKKAEH